MGYGYSPGVLGGGGSASMPETTVTGIFDYFDRGVNSLSNAWSSYLTATGRNPQTPERQVEYLDVPRDIQGPVISNQGFALSWQLVAFGLIAFVALTQLKD